jgi:hypothetical protein
LFYDVEPSATLDGVLASLSAPPPAAPTPQPTPTRKYNTPPQTPRTREPNP